MRTLNLEDAVRRWALAFRPAAAALIEANLAAGVVVADMALTDAELSDPETPVDARLVEILDAARAAVETWAATL